MRNVTFALRYLKGMYSFGLLETRFYDQAEKVAMEVRLPASTKVCSTSWLSSSRSAGLGLSGPIFAIVSVRFGRQIAVECQ